MTDKEKLIIVRDMAQLQIMIMNRFNTFISEQIIRRGITEDDIENFKSSINFIMDEQFGFVNRRLSEKQNERRVLSEWRKSR